MECIAYLDNRPVAWLRADLSVIQLYGKEGIGMATKKTAKKTSKTTKKH
jgi:hypothetical protein